MKEKENLRLALVQSNIIWEDIHANLGMLEEKIWTLDQEVDIIVLPEMFTTGFTNQTKLAEPMNLTTTKWMKQMAKQTKSLILGSVLIQEKDLFFNRMLIAFPDGKVDFYDKKHLFRMANENQFFAAGQKKCTINYLGWKINPIICYDLRFPLWCRNKFNHATSDYDYDLLLCVANWPAARQEVWQTLLKARSIENLAYVVGVNRVGIDGNQKEYNGGSNIFFPDASALRDHSILDEIRCFEIEKKKLNLYRKQFPTLLDADQFHFND